MARLDPDGTRVSPEVDDLLQDASLARSSRDFADALALCEEADGLATNDRDRAEIADTRAAIMIERGDLVGARAVLEHAVGALERSVRASTWGNLGFVLDRLNEHQKGAVAHRRCVEALERALGADHPRVAKQLGDLAYSLIGLGEHDEAESLLRDAVRRFEAAPGREPQWHARALSNLGLFLLRTRGAPVDALDCFDRADALRDSASLRIGGRVIRPGFLADFEAVLLENRAAALAALGRVDEAEDLRVEARALARSPQSPR